MKMIGRWFGVACGGIVLAGVVPALAMPLQQSKPVTSGSQTLPAGEAWTDTIVEMRNRGVNGSNQETEKILQYMTANFGPQGSSDNVNVSSASAPAMPAPPTSAAGHALPPKKPQATPQKVIAEHFAAFNSCDWNRLMAQYDDDMAFLSKDGDVVRGRQAVAEMFRKVLQPHSAGGQCGITLTPEQTIVVGDTVNIVWRADAPFLAEPYRGSEAFETRNGLLVVQVTTWDPSAMKLKK
jgi:hypothetical protein